MVLIDLMHYLKKFSNSRQISCHSMNVFILCLKKLLILENKKAFTWTSSFMYETLFFYLCAIKRMSCKSLF